MTTRVLAILGLALIAVFQGCSTRTDEPDRAPGAVGPALRASGPTTIAPTASLEAPPSKASDADTTPEAAGKDEPTAPTTPDELVAEAERTARQGDPAGAIRLLEQAVASQPDHRKAILELAVFNQERANALERPQNSPFYVKSASWARRLRDTFRDLTPPEQAIIPDLFYNEACTYAVQNEPDKALGTLAEAIDAGFSKTDLLDEDDELDTIRESPRFAELRQRTEQHARARAREDARTLLARMKPFPFDFKLSDLDGKAVTLDDVKGKVTIVDIWGTWCPPCRREIPHFKKLLEQYRDRGLAIIGINYERVDEAEVKATVKAFVKEHAIPYPCLIGDDETRGQVPNFQGFPTTLFLDGSGTVRALTLGYQSFFGLDAIVALLFDEQTTNP